MCIGGPSPVSISSRISAHIRVKSRRAACALRWQNASSAPSCTRDATATPRRPGSSPTMWRTMTSSPKLPVRPATALRVALSTLVGPLSKLAAAVGTDLLHPGFPLAEIYDDGASVITKHAGSGGLVSVDTVTAQLLYEITGARYANPDVTVRMDSFEVSADGTDRVRIDGVRGEPPPPTDQSLSDRKKSELRALPAHLPSPDIVHEPSCTCRCAAARCARSARMSPAFSITCSPDPCRRWCPSGWRSGSGRSGRCRCSWRIPCCCCGRSLPVCNRLR